MSKETIVNIQEAKTHLSRHLETVAATGEGIVIAKAGKPIARLVPYKEERAPRRLGRFAGMVAKESSDCWTPDEQLAAEFEDSTLYHSTEWEAGALRVNQNREGEVTE